MALNALNYLDRYVAAATLPLILADLTISDAQGGLIQSLFIVACSLACAPAGWLGDRVHPVRALRGVHLLGDAASLWLIGVWSDRIGLRMPVLVTGCRLAAAGLVLLSGRATLETDLIALRAPASTPKEGVR